MSFAKLPLEVTDIIVHFLALSCRKISTNSFRASTSRLSAYATISRGVQTAVERRNFAELALESSELNDFKHILVSSPLRRASIGKIRFQIILPDYSKEQCKRFETAEDQQTNSEAFTNAMVDLFTVPETCDGNDDPHCKLRAAPIDLQICNPVSCMDRGRLRQFWLWIDHDLSYHRYERSVLKILRLDAVPELRRVRSFHFEGDRPRCLAPEAAIHIFSKLPNVEKIDALKLSEELMEKELRVNSREKFGLAIQALSLPKLVSLDFRCSSHAPRDQTRNGVDVRARPIAPVDEFSIALGHFIATSRLVKINLRGGISITPELFWQKAFDSPQQDLWPNVQDFSLVFSPVRPDGGWYFDRDPADPAIECDSNEASDEDTSDEEDSDEDISDEEESDEEDIGQADNEIVGVRDAKPSVQTEDPILDVDSIPAFNDSANSDSYDVYDPEDERRRVGDYPIRSFRKIPTTEGESLFAAAAHAGARMPALRRLTVISYLNSSSRQRFEFELIKHWNDGELDHTACSRLYWRGPPNWRPGKELQASCEEMLGPGGIVRFEEWTGAGSRMGLRVRAHQ